MARFDKIGFFPYTFDDSNNLVILFQKDQIDGEDVLLNFGEAKNKYEMNGYYAGIRSFTLKTKGAFQSTFYSGVQTYSDFSPSDLYSCYQPGLKNILKNDDYAVLHHILDSKMNVFNPLQFFISSEVLNQDLKNSGD